MPGRLDRDNRSDTGNIARIYRHKNHQYVIGARIEERITSRDKQNRTKRKPKNYAEVNLELQNASEISSNGWLGIISLVDLGGSVACGNTGLGLLHLHRTLVILPEESNSF